MLYFFILIKLVFYNRPNIEYIAKVAYLIIKIKSNIEYIAKLSYI